MVADPVCEEWILYLYVAGMTPAATRAKANILVICEEHLAGRYSLEIIDLLERPEMAEVRQIVAVPTLVRKMPPPIRKIIGDLSNSEMVVWGLDIVPRRC
jgi:circadian clock protein KaiB